MKKYRGLFSFLSVFISGLLLIYTFTLLLPQEPAQANALVDGVKGTIQGISEGLIDKLNLPNNNESDISSQTLEKAYLGGFPVGFKLYADGVVIVDTEAVDTENGMVDTAKKAGLMVGDVIKEINGNSVTSNNQVSNIIEQSNGAKISLKVLRNGNYFNVNFNTEYSVSECKYKAGIWIRDSSAGIGTVTFCTQQGYFASLGHAVCDIDTKQIIPIAQGETTDVSIVNFTKGKSGVAGELCGYLESEKTGNVFHNSELGVYGNFNTLPSTPLVEIASLNEVKTGDATIFTTLEDGKIQEFKIQITGIDKGSAENKHLVIRVTDDALIEKTGGIIQGMSGSPIIQNGKLVGAVTHVFLNDPTGGYGIFAQTMLDNVHLISNKVE